MATFRVEYISGPGGTVGCRSVTGTGKPRELLRRLCLIKGPAPIIGVNARAREHHKTSHTITHPKQLLGLFLVVADAIE